MSAANDSETSRLRRTSETRGEKESQPLRQFFISAGIEAEPSASGGELLRDEEGCVGSNGCETVSTLNERSECQRGRSASEGVGSDE